MENEIVEALNRHTALLNQLISLVKDLVKKKTIDQEWYDAVEAKRLLKVSDRTLYRLRINHSEHCKKILGKWYYNLAILMMFKAKD